MRTLTTTIALILICLFGHSQTFVLKMDDLQKVIFIDHQNNNYESAYGTVYELEPSGDNFKLYQTERYFKNIRQETLDKYKLKPSEEKLLIREVPKTDLKNLITAITDTKYDTIQLAEFGYSASYLQNNAERLARSYYGYDRLKKDQQNYLIEQLQNEEKVTQVLPACFSVWMTSDYPTCAIQFIYSADTIHVYSDEQDPYMIPWNLNKVSKSYNPAISKFFASIIPHDNFSNKSRLEGKDYLESSIAEKVYRWFCEPKFESEKLEKLLKKEIDLINQHFDVSDVIIGSMGSINWDMFEDGDCWNAKLQDKNEPNNLFFDVTMDNNGKPGSIKPLLEQKDEILQRTHKAKFLIDHIANNPKRTIKIHFTKDKSFSPKAQKSFLDDVPADLKEQFDTELDSTIFLTLSNENGWSRWLIFPDGQIMLWHYSGKPPIDNYNEEQIKIPGGLFKNSCKLFDLDGQLKN
jgi:hypothetical protein